MLPCNGKHTTQIITLIPIRITTFRLSLGIFVDVTIN